MRFIDASVFLYAFLKPKRRLPGEIIKLKGSAKRIIERINKGEDVITTVVHLAEIANILESHTNVMQAINIIEAILSKKNIHVYPVTVTDYIESIEIAKKNYIGLNDALAVLFMKRLGINEIYSYDSDFDKIANIKKITE